MRTSQYWPFSISTEHRGHSVDALNSLEVNLSTWYTRLSDTSITAPDQGGVWPHDGTCRPESLSHRISKQIVAAQKNDKDITTVRNWISSGTFPECVQDFAPASYELKSYWIGHKSLYLDAEDVLWRTRSATGACAQLVVPLSLRDTIFNDSHHTTYGGHFGMTHTHSVATEE